MIKLNIQRFGHTNQTTHYELPQFIGTDKPQWLTDINQAFSGIDSAIYDADSKGVQANNNIGTMSNLDTDVKSTIVGAINEVNTNTDNNTTNIGNMSNLTPSANTSLVEAINEVDAHADANATNIGTMANLETTNKNSLVGAINEILNILDVNNTFEDFNPATSGDISVSNASLYTNEGMLYCSSNQDGTMAKIYGYVRLNTESSNNNPIVSIQTSLRPKTDITVNSIGIVVFTDSNDNNNVVSTDITIKTNGVVELRGINGSSINRNRIIIHPCLILVKDFGDVPTPPTI